MSIFQIAHKISHHIVLPNVVGSNTSINYGANVVYCIPFYLHESINVFALKVSCILGNAGAQGGVGVYDTDGNAILRTAIASLDFAAAGIKTAVFALGVKLAGKRHYYLCFATNDTVATWFAYTRNTNHVSLNTGTLIDGTAANPMVGNFLPTTLGLITQGVGNMHHAVCQLKTNL